MSLSSARDEAVQTLRNHQGHQTWADYIGEINRNTHTGKAAVDFLNLLYDYGSRLALTNRLSDQENADAIGDAVMTTLESLQPKCGSSSGPPVSALATIRFFQYVVKRRFIDLIRKRQRARRRLPESGLDPATVLAECSLPNPVTVSQLIALQPDLTSELGPKCGKVFELLLQGEEVTQIAAATSIPKSTVYSHQKRIYLYVRARLKVA